MRDFSIVLPSWAVREGYKLEGGTGTYDELYLSKNREGVRKWDCMEPIPNIFEMEILLNEIEDSEIRP